MKEHIMYDWLHRRKISDDVIDEFGIKWGHHPKIGDSIVIPVHDIEGKFLFNKYRRSPLSNETPKYVYDSGGKLTLYALHRIKDAPRVLITEGEGDCLVAWSHNIPAVSSTGGALSFDIDWAKHFANKETIICLDNDGAGGAGMAKILDIIPSAKLLFLPDRPGIKDISDYASSGGDLNEFIKTAIRLPTREAVIDDRAERLSLWKSVYFHDSYIKNHTAPAHIFHTNRTDEKDEIKRAKTYSITNLIRFVRNKSKCPWHSEHTASLNYYREDNRVYCFGCGRSADAIDVYQQLHTCSFREAVEALQ